jgi:6-pyruvoyltetrahydropterin/6-carboxytetrahydropterin synthase
MLLIQTEFTIAGAHQLQLPYESKCNGPHGHNWKISITLAQKEDEPAYYGMLLDFTAIKTEIHSRLDHKNLNDVLPYQPTAENLARWIAGVLHEHPSREHVPWWVQEVVVEESPGNRAIYRRDPA